MLPSATLGENITGQGGEIKTPLENSGVNRTISVRGGEGRETTAQRERENRFGPGREGGECSQGRKFDDDHDYDG